MEYYEGLNFREEQSPLGDCILGNQINAQPYRSLPLCPWDFFLQLRALL
jgi:hypothetical protein